MVLSFPDNFCMNVTNTKETGRWERLGACFPGLRETAGEAGSKEIQMGNLVEIYLLNFDVGSIFYAYPAPG